MQKAWGAHGALVLSVTIAVVSFGGADARGALPAAPSGRAFERVSPQDTNGIQAFSTLGSPSERIVGDGELIYGGAASPISGDTPSGRQDVVLAHRTPTGWTESRFEPSVGPNGYAQPVGVAPGASAAVFSVRGVTADFPNPDQVVAPSLIYRSAAGRLTTIVTDPDASSPSDLAGLTDDGQTVVYASDTSPAGLPPSGGLRHLYEWHPGGLAAKVPDGTGLPADCGSSFAGSAYGSSNVTSGLGGVYGGNSIGLNVVSSDGATVFVANGQPTGSTDCPASQVYVSRGGSTTLISAPTESGVAAPDPSSEGPAQFVGASTDGDVAYFLTANRLTTDASSGQLQLYEWRAAHGSTPAAVTCASCAVAPFGAIAPVAVSADGRYAYFGSHDDPSLNGTGPIGLNVAHDGAAQLIATTQLNAFASVIPDAAGNVAVFPLPPSNAIERVVVGAGQPQVSCLSCDASGDPQSGDLGNGANLGAGSNPVEQVISDDGDEAVFASPAPLTSDAPAPDLGAENVYLWTAERGLSLVAPDAQYPVISPSGADVIFQSTDALTADTTQVGVGTLYDARVGGGFPVSAPTPACDPSGCRGVAPGAPGVPRVASGGRTSGPVSQPLRLGPLRAPSRRALIRFVRGQALRVRVSASAATSVRAVLSRRGTETATTLASARATARDKPGEVTLVLRLSRSARAAVAGRRPVPATLTVTAPGGLTRTLKLTLPGRPA